MPARPGTETRGPAGAEAEAEAARDAAAPGAEEPMTNAPIPLAEEEPGVGLSRANDDPDDEAGGRGL